MWQEDRKFESNKNQKLTITATRSNKPQGHGQTLMKRKSCSLFILLVLCSTIAFAQTKVLTTDGKMFMASAVETSKESVTLTMAGENQSFQKSDILVVVPDGKKGFTYRTKNGQKLKIRNRYINNSYQGTDIPKIYAYKNLGGKPDIQQMYVKHGDTSLSFEEFNKIYKKQQQKIKTGNIVSISLSAFILLIVVV